MDSAIVPGANSLMDNNAVRSKYYGLIPVGFLIIVIVIRMIVLCRTGQKTREPQRRRMYVVTRGRPSLGQTPPTIYVSPANLPPPPKYEAIAPPSYEEVVGIHYPNYQPMTTQIAVQPITQPILNAVAQSSSESTNTSLPTTTFTVSTETRRTSVTVASQ